MNVEFRWKDHKTSIDIISKFTCIVGNDSGEGKSKLLGQIEDGILDGSLEIIAPCNVIVASPVNVIDLLEIPTRKIIIIDEFTVLRNAQIEKIKKSIHLFICISRGMPLHLSYSYYGIYNVHEYKEHFELSRANTLNISSNIPKDACIVTEAAEKHSEAELLQLVGITNIKCAGGRDRVYRFIDSLTETVVFLDLGNIGQAYSLLMRKSKRSSMQFYDYQCFEQLLSEAPCLKDLRSVELDPLTFESLERYFESLVEEKTRGSKYQYRHGRPLKNAWYEEPVENILDSDVGRGLLDYVNSKTKSMTAF